MLFIVTILDDVVLSECQQSKHSHLLYARWHTHWTRVHVCCILERWVEVRCNDAMSYVRGHHWWLFARWHWPIASSEWSMTTDWPVVSCRIEINTRSLVRQWPRPPACHVTSAAAAAAASCPCVMYVSACEVTCHDVGLRHNGAEWQCSCCSRATHQHHDDARRLWLVKYVTGLHTIYRPTACLRSVTPLINQDWWTDWHLGPRH